MRSIEGPAKTRVESVMSRHVLCMDAGDPLDSAIRTMSSRRQSCIVVTRGGQPCGVLTERDVTRLAATRAADLGRMTIREGMSATVTTITPDTTLADAARLMRKHDYRRFPVVSEQGELVGLVTQSDIVLGLNEALKNYSRHLEQEVATRTRHLREANEQLARLSLTDPLTGLHNRRALFDHLERQSSRLQRSGGSLSCILLDIDHFKVINDSYGHDCGDQVLIGFARVLREGVRRYDFVARHGGEEFLIVSECGEDTAAGAAERIRARISDLPFSTQGASFTVTVSAGVADQEFPSPQQDAYDLIRRADAALYAAKGTGRNRVVPASKMPQIECPEAIPAAA